MNNVTSSGMDVVRERKRRVPRSVAVALAVVVLLAGVAIAAYSLAHTSSGGVLVDRSSIVMDVAKRGTLMRAISASGTFVSEDVRVVAAEQTGIVQQVFVKPGAFVHTGTPIARLSNPDLDAAVVAARSAVQVAQAELISAQAQAKSAALTQQSTVAGAQAQMQEDVTNVEALKQLHSSGFVADTTYRIAAIKARQSQRQVEISHSQLTVDAANQDAKVTEAQAQVDQASAALAAKQAQVDALVVHARSAGVVQSVAVDPGAAVSSGAELARVADQRTLKAVLQIPEGQVHDVTIGMRARVDTGNGTALGRVARIAPSAQNGSVAVDVDFDRPLPAGSRPDLNVDGTVDLERIPNAVSIARPAGAADDSAVSLYKVLAGGSQADLVQVRLGRGSTDRIAVLSGLTAGDTVIVSDTSAYGGAPVLRLH
jgi:multidrug resistance efflux pump